MTFVIILNIHFWNYFVLSPAYVREPPCNNFDSASSDQPSLVCLISQLLFLIFCGQDYIIRVNLHSRWAHFAFQPSHPIYIFLHALTFYLYPSKESSMSVQCHSASLRATGGTFPLWCVRYFLCSITLFFLRFFTTGEVGVGGLYRRRISIYDMRKNPEEGGLQAYLEEEEVNEGDDNMVRYGWRDKVGRLQHGGEVGR